MSRAELALWSSAEEGEVCPSGILSQRQIFLGFPRSNFNYNPDVLIASGLTHRSSLHGSILSDLASLVFGPGGIDPLSSHQEEKDRSLLLLLRLFGNHLCN